MSWMGMCPSKPTLGYTTVVIIIIIITVYRFTDCHNVTYTTQTEVVDSNTSLSLQTPAVNFTVENKTVRKYVGMYNNVCTYLSKYRLKLILGSQ